MRSPSVDRLMRSSSAARDLLPWLASSAQPMRCASTSCSRASSETRPAARGASGTRRRRRAMPSPALEQQARRAGSRRGPSSRCRSARCARRRSRARGRCPASRSASNAWRTTGDSAGTSLPRAREEAAQEVIGQRRDVLAPLAQRRQQDRHDVQAVEQVFAELPVVGELLQAALRSGDDPHVDRDRLRPADAFDRPVLQHAQQLHLHRPRHVVDVVEEDGAAVGQLEAAGVIPQRAGEGAALVAEELRLDQRLGQDRAAHRARTAAGGGGSSGE